MSWLTDRLSALLRERNQGAESLARQLGIERSRMANIIAGSAIPNENLTKRLARYFGDDPEEWLVNVARSPQQEPVRDLPRGFVKVAATSDIHDGEMKIVADGLIAVAHVQGRFYAFGNVCPHAAGPIGEGFLEGLIVECPWHAGQWNIATGRALTALATADITIFEVRVVGDDLEVRLKAFAQGAGEGG